MAEFDYSYTKAPHAWLLYLSGALSLLFLAAYLFLPYGYAPYLFIAFLGAKAVCDFTFSRLNMVEIFKKQYHDKIYTSSIIDIIGIAAMLVYLFDIYPISFNTILWGWIIMQSVWASFVTLADYFEAGAFLTHSLATFLLFFSVVAAIWLNSFIFIGASLLLYSIERGAIALSIRHKKLLGLKKTPTISADELLAALDKSLSGKSLILLLGLLIPLGTIAQPAQNNTDRAMTVEVAAPTTTAQVVLNPDAPLWESITEEWDAQITSQKEKWQKQMPFMVFTIMALGGLFFITLIIKDIAESTASLYTAMILISIIELLFFTVADGGTWFCSPSQVGWFWTVVNFIIFGALLYVQYSVFAALTTRITGVGTFASCRVGIISASIGVGALLAHNYFAESIGWLPTVAWAIIITGQVVQLIINLLRDNLVYGVAVWLMYIICFSALVLAMAYFMALLLVAFLIYCAIAAIAAGGRSNTSSSSNSNQASSTSDQGGWGAARNCPHFSEAAMMCDFSTGGRCECGMLNNGRCQKGQM